MGLTPLENIQPIWVWLLGIEQNSDITGMNQGNAEGLPRFVTHSREWRNPKGRPSDIHNGVKVNIGTFEKMGDLAANRVV